MTTVDFALRYAERGWHVFPVWPINEEDHSCACGLATCKNAGKHPLAALVPEGNKQATTDGQVIRQWWAGWPDANIGILTGAISRLVIIDVDGQDALDNFGALAADHGDLPYMPLSATGRGWHLWFRHPGGKIVTRAGQLGNGIDVRADGGAVIAPPSLHANGRRYQWQPGPAGLPALPEWLLRLMAESRRRDEGDVVGAPILEGSRDQHLASLAGTMRRRGMIEDEILAALLVVNRRCVPPLEEAQVIKIARSVGRYEPAGRSSQRSTAHESRSGRR